MSEAAGRHTLSVRQYSRFLTVGAVVGIVSIVCREFFGRLLGDGQALQYSISVVAAYVVGILLSFLINGKFTFGAAAGGRRDWSRFPSFVAVAAVGLVATWVFSLGLRFGLSIDAVAGRYSGMLAFVVATVMASMITYPLNALLVFRTSAR